MSDKVTPGTLRAAQRIAYLTLASQLQRDGFIRTESFVETALLIDAETHAATALPAATA